jgi:hypothetical protein
MNVLRRVVVLFLLVLFASPLVSAQESTPHAIRKEVSALLTKYKGEKGVKAMECNGGAMLQTVKLMLRKQFGEEAANTIHAFAIMLYEDAPSECVGRIVGDIAHITKMLQEVDISDRMKNGERARGYVRLSESGKKITNLIIVVAAPKPKLIYIEGDFDAKGAKQQ